MHRISYEFIIACCIYGLCAGAEMPGDLPHVPERAPAPGPAAPAFVQVSTASSSADLGGSSGRGGVLPITLR